MFAASAAIAQNDGLFGKVRPSLVSEEGEMVELYGQKLDPASVAMTDTDYTWKDLQKNVSELLPLGASEEKTPQELCDYLGDLSRLYMNTYDGAVSSLAVHFEGVFPNEADAELSVADRLRVKDGIDALLKAGGEALEGKVMMALQAHHQYLTLQTLSDAAQVNCPQPPELAPDLGAPAVAPAGGVKP